MISLIIKSDSLFWPWLQSETIPPSSIPDPNTSQYKLQSNFSAKDNNRDCSLADEDITTTQKIKVI